MWTKELQHNQRGQSDLNGYKGIPIYAGYNLHKKCFELFESHVTEKSSSILILGAGAGAFDQRLIDNGYANVTAIEFNDELYKADGKVISLDLNTNFSSMGEFDVVVAMEVIEHVENQFDFLKQISNCLKAGGVALVSTPNVESTLSRIKFFLRGELSFFTKKEVTDTGHINPLFNYIFKVYIQSVRLKVIEETFNTSVWNLAQYNTLKQKILVTILGVLRPVMKNKNNGQISIFLLKKD